MNKNDKSNKAKPWNKSLYSHTTKKGRSTMLVFSVLNFLKLRNVCGKACFITRTPKCILMGEFYALMKSF